MPRKGQDLPRLSALAAPRGGVVSMAELSSCGFSRGAVARRVDEGAWQRFGSSIWLFPHRPEMTPSDAALSWTLHFTFGPSVRVSGMLALRRAGWRLPGHAHIVVLPEKPHVQFAGVTILRRPDEASRGPVDEPRHVEPREALVDCLTVMTKQSATELLDVALQRRCLMPEALADVIANRLGRGRRSAAQLRMLRDRALSGSRSEAEQRMAALLKRSGTGLWVPNFAVHDSAGRVTAEIDFAHVRLKIAIEVDGRAFHSDRRSFERDRERQNVLVLGGWLILRFTWEQITQRPQEVIAVVRAAVAQRATA